MYLHCSLPQVPTRLSRLLNGLGRACTSSSPSSRTWAPRCRPGTTCVTWKRTAGGWSSTTRRWRWANDRHASSPTSTSTGALAKKARCQPTTAEFRRVPRSKSHFFLCRFFEWKTFFRASGDVRCYLGLFHPCFCPFFSRRDLPSTAPPSCAISSDGALISFLLFSSALSNSSIIHSLITYNPSLRVGWSSHTSGPDETLNSACRK